MDVGVLSRVKSCGRWRALAAMCATARTLATGRAGADAEERKRLSGGGVNRWEHVYAAVAAANTSMRPVEVKSPPRDGLGEEAVRPPQQRAPSRHPTERRRSKPSPDGRTGRLLGHTEQPRLWPACQWGRYDQPMLKWDTAGGRPRAAGLPRTGSTTSGTRSSRARGAGRADHVLESISGHLSPGC